MKSNRAKVLHELGRLALDCARASEQRNHWIRKRFSWSSVTRRKRLSARCSLKSAISQALSFRRSSAALATRSNPARSELENSDSLVLVLSGDVPMIRSETLRKFIDHHDESGAACSILSVRLENPRATAALFATRTIRSRRSSNTETQRKTSARSKRSTPASTASTPKNYFEPSAKSAGQRSG